MIEMQISKSASEIADAASIRVNQMVYDLKRAGHEPVVLSLGEAFFDLPLYDFRQLDFERGYHYSDTQGLPDLREKIAGFYRDHYHAPVDPHAELMITTGSKAAILLAMLATLNPGDDILVHEPCWLSYPHQARICGAGTVFIPYQVQPAEFEKFITNRTRMLIINNPNNPAGRLYTSDELQTIYTACRSRGIYVLVDEAYSDFVLDEPFCSMAEVVPDKDGVIVVNSLSKNMGMSGWRIGYIITSPKLLPTLIKLNQHSMTCAPTLLMQYVAHYFDKILSVSLPQVREVVEKRRRVATMLDRLGLHRLSGDATFYFFVSIGDFPGTSEDFAMQLLLRRMVAVVPGSAYGRSTDRFVRISVGAESEERIWEALQMVKTLTRVNEPSNFDYNEALALLTERKVTASHGR